MSAPTLDDLQEQLKVLQAQVQLFPHPESLPSLVNPEKVPHPTSVTTSGSTNDTHFKSVIDRLDDRIVNAKISEMHELLYVRDQLIKQEEGQANRSHVRALEKGGFYAKVGLSFAAFAGGVGLVILEFGLPGFVCIGAGLYAIAPSFIDRVTGHVIGKNKP